jgi:hypothetical protein
MKWMIEEARLGEDQKDIIAEVGKLNGKPIWIQGHAGSGKSVVLLHCLSDYLIRHKNARVAIVVFTHALGDLLKTGLKQIPALANRSIPVYTIYGLRNQLDKGERYDAIFCDEVQDLPLSFINKMKEGCAQLFIAGDAAQSIYGKVPIFNERPANKNEIGLTIQPIEKISSTIYRLTQSILNVLKNVYLELVRDKTYIGKEDSEIRLYQADDITQETIFCWEESEMINTTRPSEVNAILLFKKDDIVFFINEVLKFKGKETWESVRTSNNDYDFYSLNSHLEKVGLPLMYVGNNYGSLEQADVNNKVIIMTYHSSKGLDFDAVCLPYIHTDLSATSNINALILVALSRAKRDLFITSTGGMYSGFKKFLINTNVKKISSLISNEDEILF